MRNRGLVVVVVVTCFSCFSTARYDRAYSQRVSNINARYDAELEREREHYLSLVTELDKRRAFVIPVKPESGNAPVHRVDERAGIVECRLLCGSDKPGDTADPLRARNQTAAQCIRDVCQPAYVDALVKTYFRADIASVMTQVSASKDAELESLLAASHNQALLAEIDRRATLLAQQHAQTGGRIEQQRHRALQASLQLRTTEIAAGHAARSARVKAAADAFAAEARGEPSFAPATSRRTGGSSRETGRRNEDDCAGDQSCAAPVPATAVTCMTDAHDPAGRVTEPAGHSPVEPSTPIGCSDQQDCPSGQVCDAATGVCCVESVR